jgi:hypothetical protein
VFVGVFSAPVRITPEVSGSDSQYFVRCVRGGPFFERAPGPRFARIEPVAGYPVVTDATTGLVWQGCQAGRAGTDCAGSPADLDWSDALAYCEGSTWAGFTDWHLPNVKEMRSVVDDHRDSPSMAPDVFPAMESGWFYSSTSTFFYYGGSTGTYAANGASVVSNTDGTVFAEGKAYPWGVLCVRDGP